MSKSKKAWEMELEVMTDAVPVVLKDEEQGWGAIEAVENMDDLMLKMKWHSAVPGSGAPERVIIGAVQSLDNMGFGVSELEALIPEGLRLYDNNDLIGLNRLTSKMWNMMEHAEKVPNHPYHKYKVYETFDDYLSSVRFPKPKKYDVNDHKYEESLYAGWCAQIVGGAIGTAVEGYTPQAIRKAFGSVKGYVRKPNTYNDDITYEIAFLKAAERKGKNLNASDIAEEWAALIPFGWSAEEWALKNIKLGIYPPLSGKLHNPYREWIGAQMRGAAPGMMAPGDYMKAARYAFMDGIVSHHNNGVLGEVFNALLVAGSFVNADTRKLLKEVIGLIPHDSEYRSVIDFALNECLTNDDPEVSVDNILKKYREYNWIHAYPNAAIEVVSLWYGNGDFDKTMEICANAGYDADCNAAQIATVLGIQNGIRSIKDKWLSAIGDRLDTYIRGHKVMSIKDLAKMTAETGRLLK